MALGSCKLLLLLSFITIALAGFQCPPDAWKSCVGNSYPSFCCFDAEKAIVAEYNRINVEKDYQSAAFIFDVNITTAVPFFGISFQGLQVNVAYLYLNDGDVTDLYDIVNITILNEVLEYFPSDEGFYAQVFVSQNVYYYNLQTDLTFASYEAIRFAFTPQRRISYIEIYPDSLQLSLNLPALEVNNVTLVCEGIATYCTGVYQQYANLTDCTDFMSTLRIGSPTSVSTGNSVTCRAFHTRLAISLPSVHCIHTGPQKISPIATPCNDWP